MTIALYAAATLTVAIALAHSILGERYKMTVIGESPFDTETERLRA